MTSIKIHIPGDPPKSWGKNGKIARSTRLTNGKNKNWLQSKPKTVETKELIYYGVLPQAPEKPLEGAYTLSVTAGFPWLGEHSKRTRAGGPVWKTTAPDVDGILTTIQDALQDAGYFKVDAQLAEVSCRKYHCDTPGIFITLRPAEEVP